jgi:hypothetical protein
LYAGQAAKPGRRIGIEIASIHLALCVAIPHSRGQPGPPTASFFQKDKTLVFAGLSFCE